MITRDNFTSFIQGLSNEQKEVIKNDDFDNEYLYISLSSYGDVITFEPTNDNDGKYSEEMQSEDWDGMSYLLLMSEVQDILN